MDVRLQSDSSSRHDEQSNGDSVLRRCISDLDKSVLSRSDNATIKSYGHICVDATMLEIDSLQAVWEQWTSQVQKSSPLQVVDVG